MQFWPSEPLLDTCYKHWKKAVIIKNANKIFKEILVNKEKTPHFPLFFSVSDRNWHLFGPAPVLREACLLFKSLPCRWAVWCVNEKAQASDSWMETETEMETVLTVTVLALSHFPAVLWSLLPVVWLCTCMLIRSMNLLAVVCRPLLVCHLQALCN